MLRWLIYPVFLRQHNSTGQFPIQLAVATAHLFALQLLGGVICFGNSPQEQVQIGSQLVELQKALNEEAAQTLAFLQSVRNEPSSRQALPELSISLQKLTADAKSFCQEIEKAKDTIGAPAPESDELNVRWEQLGQEMSLLTQNWICLSRSLRRENERVEKIRGLSTDFWNSLRSDWVQFEFETLDVLKWTGRSLPSSTRQYLETKLAQFKQHGPEKVFDVVVLGATPEELESQADTLRSFLGDTAKVALRISRTSIRSVITVSPASDIESIIQSMSVGDLLDQDNAAHLLVVSVRGLRMSLSEIDMILDNLTDNGEFLAISSANRGSLRNIIEQEGPKSILAVELHGLTLDSRKESPLRFVWSNAETGKLILARSGKTKGVYRGLLRYNKTASNFAQQVEYGEVQSINEEKRRVLILVDLAKLTPESLLASRSLQGNPDAKQVRSDLQEKIHEETLEALGAGDQIYFHDRNDEEEEMIAKLESLEKRQSEEFNEAFDFTKQAIDAPVDVQGLVERHRRESKGLRSKSGFDAGLASFEPNRHAQIPSAEQFVQLAEMLEKEDTFGLNRKKAIQILLKLRPADVVDKKTFRRIALGFKQLAFESHFEQPDGIRGMVIWGGKHSVPPLIELLESNKLSVPLELYVALIKLQDSRGAKAVTKLLGDFHNHDSATECLRRMGAVAEEALIEVAPSDNSEVSLTAIELLGEVGTEKSYEILRQARKSRNPEVREAAGTSNQLIRKRSKPTTSRRPEGKSPDDR